MGSAQCISSKIISTGLDVAAAQGGVTEGLYAMGLTDMPYRDTLGSAAQSWFDRYKERPDATRTWRKPAFVTPMMRGDKCRKRSER